MVVALLSACALPSGGPTWSPVDVADVEARLASPTASRDEVLIWISTSAATIGLLSGTGATFTQVMGALGDPDTDPESSEDTGRLSGTEVFIQAACSGPGDSPDFDYGFIEIESPVLSLSDLEEVSIGGDLLLTARACQDSDSRYDGELAAWFEPTTSLLVLDGELKISSEEGEEETVPVEGKLAALWHFIVPLTDSEQGPTLSLDLDPDAPSTALLRYDGGSLICTVGAQVECEAS